MSQNIEYLAANSSGLESSVKYAMMQLHENKVILIYFKTYSRTVFCLPSVHVHFMY